jgi:sterol desaturase/sphingolipid hydroxylase (fatty acid hydroxylase superfamily)
VLWVSGLHLRLYTFRGQGSAYKLNPKWLGGKSPAFLWGNQLADNIFLNLANACAVCTAYEVTMMWGYANGVIAFLDWRTEPVAFALIVLAIPLWREIHNYWTHRLIHWKPLYRTVHHIHHKNVNIGPWSGLAMHPVEHIINFSAAAIWWIVPSHPLIALFTLQHTLFAPAPGHAGFHQLVMKGKFTLPSDYFHYVHHRYFECNYGNPVVPFDRWFGTFHDGSAQAHARMQERWGEKRD